MGLLKNCDKIKYPSCYNITIVVQNKQFVNNQYTIIYAIPIIQLDSKFIHINSKQFIILHEMLMSFTHR